MSLCTNLRTVAVLASLGMFGHNNVFSQSTVSQPYALTEGAYNPAYPTARNQGAPTSGGISDLDLKSRANQVLGSQLDTYGAGLGRLFQAAVSNDKGFLAKEGLNFANDKALTGLKTLFPTAEVQFGMNLDRKLEGSIIGLTPIRKYDREDQVLHGWQTSLIVTDNRYTINNGYVYRTLSENRKAIYGLNTFLDLEFPYQHRRASVGGEIKSLALDVNLQHYIPLTSWINGRDGLREVALQGTTLDVATPIPYLPRLKLGAKYSNWSGKDQGSNLSGMTYLLTGYVSPNISVDVQRRLIDGLPNSTALIVSYSVNQSNIKRKDLPFISDTPYLARDMSERLLEIVKRENVIRKQYGGIEVVTR